MKYMEKGNFKQHPLMRLTLSLTLVLFTLFWLTSFAMFFVKMNFDPQSVINYYQGNEITFQVGKSFEGLVETAHMHLPMMALVVLVLTHLCIFIPIKNTFKIAIILSGFLSATFMELSSFGVKYHHAYAWALVKIGSFILMQTIIAVMLLALAVYLWFWPHGAIHKKHKAHP